MKEEQKNSRTSTYTTLWLSGLLSVMKNYCPLNNVSDMDRNTFRAYADMMVDLYEIGSKNMFATLSASKDLDAFLKLSINLWGLQAVLSFYNDHRDMLMQVRCETDTIFVNPIILDYVEAVHDTELQRDFKLKYSDKEELISLHDNAMTAAELMRDKIKAKKVNEALERAKDLVFDNKKEQWVVIAPESTEEIVTEGAVLNHCVARYVDKIIDGSTNILFIRKRDDIKRPFFTIEITEYKEIRQVHGVNNRNVSTENGLGDFVKKYAKKKKLKTLGTDRCLV